jgi:hypothetical protein
MQHERSYYRISNQNTTQLASDLSMTDTTINLVDATRVPLPNPSSGVPGVIFINGEKIIYWRNYALENPAPWQPNIALPTGSLISYTGNLYIATGNVYALNFANVAQANISQVNRNTLAQIRRGVDGTSTANVHLAGSRVIDSSILQLIPDTSVASSTVNQATTYQVTGNVAYGITTTSNISVNVGDIITNLTTVDLWQPGTVIQTGTLTYYNGNSYTVTGNVFGPATRTWTANTAIPTNTYIADNSGNTYITIGNVYGSSFPSSNVRPIAAANVASAKFANVLAAGNLTYAFAGNTTTAVTLRALETVSNQRSFGAVILDGSIIGAQGLPELYDTSAGYDVRSFSASSSKLQINGEEVDSYIISSYILGYVNVSGQTTIPTGSTVSKAKIWYSPGYGAVTDGTGLYNSTTSQVAFLKDSPSFTAPGGKTP